MKKRFASFLLTGKAAALPFAVGNSFADVTPTYTELLSSSLSIIETPATGIRLLTTTTSATSSSYGGTGYGGDAMICNSTSAAPTTMNVVLTGLKNGDMVYLAASTAKDYANHLSLNPKLRIGNDNLVIISSFVVNHSPATQEASNIANATAAISVPLNLSTLWLHSGYSIAEGSKFYLQAMAFAGGGTTSNWQTAKYSELDEITVTAQGCSSYGGSTY